MEGARGAQELSLDGHRSTQVTNTAKRTQRAVAAPITPRPLNAIVVNCRRRSLHTVAKFKGVSGRLLSATRPDPSQIRGNGADCSASLRRGWCRPPSPLSKPSGLGVIGLWKKNGRIGGTEQICILQSPTYFLSDRWSVWFQGKRTLRFHLLDLHGS